MELHRARQNTSRVKGKTRFTKLQQDVQITVVCGGNVVELPPGIGPKTSEAITEQWLLGSGRQYGRPDLGPAGEGVIAAQRRTEGGDARASPERHRHPIGD